MITLADALGHVMALSQDAGTPLGIILAGHNGSGKSTMWKDHLSDKLRMPLINADRMMMSILPEPDRGKLVPWAAELRDSNEVWMRVAQKGVESFVGHALADKAPFAMETVFSHWLEKPDGKIESKIDRITELQQAGYCVILFFVGLPNAATSVLRVQTRKDRGGHGVLTETLHKRFGRTQKAISHALTVADAAILTDNSYGPERAFTLCRLQQKRTCLFDIRRHPDPPAAAVEWLSVVSPEH